MAKPKVGRVLLRTHKRKFGKKNPLPENLLFLSKIPFYAVTKCQLPDSKREQIRIEIFPKRLKEFVESYKTKIKEQKKDYESLMKLHKKCIENQKKSKKKDSEIKKTLKTEKESFKRELDQVISEKQELERKMAVMKTNYDQVMKNIEEGDADIPTPSIKSSWPFKKENGIKPQGIALQGGGTGVGKKK